MKNEGRAGSGGEMVPEKWERKGAEEEEALVEGNLGQLRVILSRRR